MPPRQAEARPKIVASTATIRRAADQVRAVFDREARQFPPPGLDVDRLLLRGRGTRGSAGNAPLRRDPGTPVSHTTLMVRCYGALLQAAKDLPADDEVRDAYWTLLGYFNSLRVLGGAYMQVLDDVPDRLKVVATRAGTEARELGQPGELTSRKDSSEIPRELQILETSYPHSDSPDVVLATNMISVGVDVDRLGLMVVMGQPQTTAEYIQATSRVGRKHPGPRRRALQRCAVSRPLALRELRRLPPGALPPGRGDRRDSLRGTCPRPRSPRHVGVDGATDDQRPVGRRASSADAEVPRSGG